MPPGVFTFEAFHLDPRNRRLWRGEAAVDLNARYLDALILLVSHQGELVSKTQFLEEVWRGVPVTDEALTQCIRTIRQQLGDNAANPRFIETVPKHGYRFIAIATWADLDAPPPVVPVAGKAGGAPPVGRSMLAQGCAGMIGGGCAGVVGGLFYGLGGVAQPVQSGMGASSTTLVLVALTALVGLVGGAGVSLGVSAAAFASRRHSLWSVVGGACGGMVVGAVVKLICLDTISLLFGRSPGEITGAPEGALLGAAVGLGAWLAKGRAAPSGLGRGMAVAGLLGGGAGVVISLLHGRLMGGSLALLAEQFPDSRLDFGMVGGRFSESGFGPVAQGVTSGLEGALFSAFVVGALALSHLRMARRNAGT
ncbi:winged helix-turn-helix domain-containing protein [Phenylobacterium sp.]|uniref:winged helix-turn-helix domain-containing protein n=1 Tax=Phenylobacterium sp. TaxID=1871053 RepID=UPI00286E0D6D|nr:winged helix-turn-helix domain-containing protein [Phenylobacterium sp.]